MDELKALEILALKSREKPDFTSEVRKIQRWFSKSFSTPLKEVEQLDLHYLLQHKYEDYISSLSEEDYTKYKNKLLWPEKIEQIAAEDDDWIVRELENEQNKLKEVKKEPSESEPPIEEFDITF